MKDFEKGEDGFKASLHFNPEHRVYAGHFPGRPITPGVILIQLLKELMETYAGKEVALQTVSRCKFLNILDPHSAGLVWVSAEVKAEEGIFKVHATGENGEKVFFKISATYSP